MKYYERVQVMVRYCHGACINQMFSEVNVSTLIISPSPVIVFWHHVAFITVGLLLHEGLGASEEAN